MPAPIPIAIAAAKAIRNLRRGASPAMSPVTIPKVLGFPSRSRLKIIHVSAAEAAAVFVVTKAFAAKPPITHHSSVEQAILSNYARDEVKILRI